MCGIAGIVLDGVREKDVDLMLAMISHRGPDEFGTYTDNHISLGSARLSIIDIVHGQQPMRHKDSGVVVAFNGEIFNYKELREFLLQEDYEFLTKSDTEVILNLYLKYGISFAEHLNGQFVISIWDPRDHQLILLRDRFGICPLFYYRDGNFFSFASEIKALFTNPKIAKCINLKAIDQVFTFWVPITGNTAFSNIQELPPGQLLIYKKEAGIRLVPYWRWGFPQLQDKSNLDFDEAKVELLERLSKSVSLRLRADIEVASYLSGGIDSSAIVALGKRLQPNGLNTFSISFRDKSYNESEFQEIVAKHCETSHSCVECDYADIDAYFERSVWHAEVPLFRTAPSPLNRLSGFVRSAGIKVVLTGEGSDEILLGYDIFREVKVRRFWQRRPDSVIRPQLFNKLYAYLPQFSNKRYANLAIQSYKATLASDSPFYSHILRWTNNAANKVYFSSTLKNALNGYNAIEELQSLMPDEFFQVDDIDRAQYLELVTLLRGYLLSSQGDRMLMANSVEGRYPFLDHEFVNFVSALPRYYLLPGLKDKFILRESFRGLLPDEICYRPKFAYQSPEIRAFFKLDKTKSFLVDQFLNARAIKDSGLFNVDLVEKLLKKINSLNLTRLGTRDNMALVQILSTQILHKKFIESNLREIAFNKMANLQFKTRIRIRTTK